MPQLKIPYYCYYYHHHHHHHHHHRRRLFTVSKYGTDLTSHTYFVQHIKKTDKVIRKLKGTDRQTNTRPQCERIIDPTLFISVEGI
jgi:hypothetical protein